MIMKRNTIYLLPFILFLFLLSGCGAVESILPQPTATADLATVVPQAPTATPLSEAVRGLATVESLELLKKESFPVQIDARVAGVLPNDCTQIDSVVAQQADTTFNIVVTTLQAPGTDCGQAEVPFEEVVALNVNGLPAGTYTVSVNGLEGSFNFDVDNVLSEETEPVEPTATAAPDLFTISGRVWHDLCVGGSGEEGEAPEGCIVTDDGTFAADGLLADEPGIAGVLVSLGQGACPAAQTLVSASTDEDGLFTFGNLAAGDYCVFVDSENDQNQLVLLPGRWTAPAGDTGATAEFAVVAGEGAANEDVNFGWDFELLPIDLATCSNSFAFVDDLSVPDDTVFAPGEAFTKSWRLRNNGTCPWNSEYSVVFVGGDLMSADEPIPLAQTVGVSQTLDVEVDMVAPDEPGTYRGNWQLANPAGEPFGIDGVIEDAFWLQIVVDEAAVPAATPLPNSAAIGGAVWDDFCLNSSPGRGCVESGEGSGVFIGNGTFEAFEAGLAEITISLASGACPGDGTLPASTLQTTVTDEGGTYLFEGLDDGTYCIFMDALSAENVDFLIPGNWTWPATGVGRYSFILDPGEQALDLDFGWDFVD